MIKTGKIFGQIMPPVSGYETADPKYYLPEYHKFLIQKASEPKTSFVNSTILPALVGSILGAGIKKSNRAIGALAGAALAASVGTLFKFMDDKLINKARIIQSLGVDYRDPVIAELEMQMIRDDRELNTKLLRKFLSSIGGKQVATSSKE